MPQPVGFQQPSVGLFPIQEELDLKGSNADSDESLPLTPIPEEGKSQASESSSDTPLSRTDSSSDDDAPLHEDLAPTDPEDCSTSDSNKEPLAGVHVELHEYPDNPQSVKPHPPYHSPAISADKMRRDSLMQWDLNSDLISDRTFNKNNEHLTRFLHECNEAFQKGKFPKNLTELLALVNKFAPRLLEEVNVLRSKKEKLQRLQKKYTRLLIKREILKEDLRKSSIQYVKKSQHAKELAQTVADLTSQNKHLTQKMSQMKADHHSEMQRIRKGNQQALKQRETKLQDLGRVINNAGQVFTDMNSKEDKQNQLIEQLKDSLKASQKERSALKAKIALLTQKNQDLALRQKPSRKGVLGHLRQISLRKPEVVESRDDSYLEFV